MVFPPLHHVIETISERAVGMNGIVGGAAPLLLDGLAGLVAGGLVFGVVTLVQRLLRKPAGATGPLKTGIEPDH